MQKAERKRRAAERKRKAKEAKRAKREASTNDAAGPDLVTETSAGPAHDAPVAQTPQSRPDLYSVEDEVHRAHGKMNWAEAEVVEAGTAEMLGDDEAIAMLTRAARSLDDVIQYVESVLKRLPTEQVAEAIAINNEPPRPGEKSRRGSNPAVQLINIRLRAENLMLRVMKILKPDLAKQMQSA